MGEMNYIVIDCNEKRTLFGHYGSLDAFLSTLSRNPTTVNQLDGFYQEITQEKFYDDGNRPKVPEDISLETLRTVLGIKGDDNEVIGYWKKVSIYSGANYHSYGPDEKTKGDIPELTQEIIDEWKSEDPNGEEFPTAKDYRRFLCNDGIIVADLRKKEIRWISHGAFDVPRNNLQEKYAHTKYSLPLEWNIEEE